MESSSTQSYPHISHEYEIKKLRLSSRFEAEIIQVICLLTSETGVSTWDKIPNATKSSIYANMTSKLLQDSEINGITSI